MRLTFLVAAFCLLAIANCWESEATETFEDSLDIVPCGPNCKTCENNTTCTACDDGYYLDDVNSKCSLCKDQVAHCSKCSATKNNTVICSACESGYYPFNTGLECHSCSDAIIGCTDCTLDQANDFKLDETNGVTCNQCSGGNWPTDDALQCQPCSSQIEHCQTCSRPQKYAHIECSACDSDYEVSDNKQKCDQSSSSHTVIIVVSVVGAVVLVGAGIAIWKCMQKRKKGSTLLEQGQDGEAMS